MDIQKKTYNKVILQPNSFSRAEYTFTYFQRDIVLYIQSLIHKDTKIIQKTFKITKEELADFKGIIERGMLLDDKERIFSKKVADNLATMSLKIKTSERYIVQNLWERVIYDEKDKYIEITLNEGSTQIFYPFKTEQISQIIQINPRTNYTLFKSQNLLDLKSTTSRKLLELLSSHTYGGNSKNPIIYTIEELKLIFGFSITIQEEIEDGLFKIPIVRIEEVSYKQNSHFLQLMQRCVKEISKIKDCNIVSLSVNGIKKRGRYQKIEFIYYNTNGTLPPHIYELVRRWKFSNKQAIMLYKIFGINIEEAIQKRLKVSVIRDSDNNWRMINNDIKIENPTAFLLSLFKEELNNQ